MRNGSLSSAPFGSVVGGILLEIRVRVGRTLFHLRHLRNCRTVEHGPQNEFRSAYYAGTKEEAKLKRLFQFRSAERDAETDQQRIGSIVQAINAALELAQKERVALNIRVKEARDLASFAAGTGDDEYLTRETRDTSRLADYERQMIIGEKRIRRLDEQIASLTALQELSRRCFPDFMK